MSAQAPDRFEWMRQRQEKKRRFHNRIKNSNTKNYRAKNSSLTQEALESKQTRAEIQAEDKKFFDRRRFDQGTFWKKHPEPRSLIPSVWPAFEAAVRKWGIGSLYNQVSFSIPGYRNKEKQSGRQTSHTY
jgi:hypothetical protein